MTKKNPKRSLQRKEQSERDKVKYLSDKSVYGQLAAFQQLLGIMQTQGMHGQYVPIPYELIGKLKQSNKSQQSSIFCLY